MTKTRGIRFKILIIKIKLHLINAIKESDRDIIEEEKHGDHGPSWFHHIQIIDHPESPAGSVIRIRWERYVLSPGSWQRWPRSGWASWRRSYSAGWWCTVASAPPSPEASYLSPGGHIHGKTHSLHTTNTGEWVWPLAFELRKTL